MVAEAPASTASGRLLVDPASELEEGKWARTKLTAMGFWRVRSAQPPVGKSGQMRYGTHLATNRFGRSNSTVASATTITAAFGGKQRRGA